ncbi:hypothetical protein N7495_002499 [Penicillium taxi]|uniref:uncharacterized protein n=1 Tax=Penicillium taxi TaxID=168475 RepID=UPI00254584BC|nr:uncharacterized protein N7495_002499 [Penicillium taxi]KAJ5901971.1 hypothetical protein N7495_002499 [Penicillium taxi]
MAAALGTKRRPPATDEVKNGRNGYDVMVKRLRLGQKMQVKFRVVKVIGEGGGRAQGADRIKTVKSVEKTCDKTTGAASYM